MEGKKSFVLYTDLIHTVKKLPKEKQADLFVMILEYVNDENPTTDDLLIDIAFEPIKRQLKRDLIKYEKRAENSRENGSKGGRPPKKDNPKEPEKPNGFNNNPKEPEKPDTVTDTVTDTDTVNDTDINKKKDFDFLIEKVKEEKLGRSFMKELKEIHPLDEKEIENEIRGWFEDFYDESYEEKDFSLIKRSISKWIKKSVLYEKFEIKHNDVFREIYSNEFYIEQLAIKYKRSKKNVQNHIDTFRKDCILKEDFKSSMKEAKTHFINWVNKGNEIPAIIKKI